MSGHSKGHLLPEGQWPPDSRGSLGWQGKHLTSQDPAPQGLCNMSRTDTQTGWVQLGIQITSQGHSDENRPKWDQDASPQAGSGWGLMREPHVRHSPSMARQGHGGGDGMSTHRSGPTEQGPWPGKAGLWHHWGRDWGFWADLIWDSWSHDQRLEEAPGEAGQLQYGLFMPSRPWHQVTQHEKSLSCHLTMKMKENPKS